MSLKAGGVGINLTAAPNAFVMVGAYQFCVLKLICICLASGLLLLKQ
jgi:hypothetical protein